MPSEDGEMKKEKLTPEQKFRHACSLWRIDQGNIWELKYLNKN